MNRSTSKIGKRHVVLRPHFIKRWRQRIGPGDAGKISSVCHSALINKELVFLRVGRRGSIYYAVEILGCRAVCTIDPTGAYVFVTVLAKWMYQPQRLKRMEEAG